MVVHYISCLWAKVHRQFTDVSIPVLHRNLGGEDTQIFVWFECEYALELFS